MLRTLWNAVAILAIANLLGLLGFTAWLWRGDRLNPDRVERIRTLLAETAADELVRLEEQARLLDEKSADVLAAQHEAVPAVSTQELLDERMEAVRLDRQRAERLRREVDDLKRTLTRERLAIDRDRESLRIDQARFDALRRKIGEIEGSEQFRNALSVLKGLKPDEAKTLLMQEIVDHPETGALDSDSGFLRVITYLDALPDRQRTKIMGEFVADDPPLAAQLLEGLRTKGLVPLTGSEREAIADGLAANQPAATPAGG